MLSQAARTENTGIGQPYLVEGAVLVVGGEGVLLQEVILQEASCLQDNLVILSKRVLHATPDFRVMRLEGDCRGCRGTYSEDPYWALKSGPL